LQNPVIHRDFDAPSTRGFNSLRPISEIITLTQQKDAHTTSARGAAETGAATAGAPEFEIVCVRAGRLWPKATGFEPANDVLDASAHLGENFQDGFPDNWLYSEDDITLEFEIKKLNGRGRRQA